MGFWFDYFGLSPLLNIQVQILSWQLSWVWRSGEVYAGLAGAGGKESCEVGCEIT